MSPIVHAKPEIPEWCMTRSVFVDMTSRHNCHPMQSAGGTEGSQVPSANLVHDVLAMIQEPSCVSVAGRALGSKVNAHECHGESARSSLWGGLRIWQDELRACGVEWRRRPATDAELVATSEGRMGGCSSFLRSRSRKPGNSDRSHGRSAHTGGARDEEGARGDEFVGATDGSGARRLLIVLAGKSLVVSLCVEERAGSSSHHQNGTDGGRSVGVEGNGDCIDDKGLRREEALWRLDAWMRCVLAR